MLKGHWLRIIGHQQDFERVTKNLSIDQRQQVIDELKQDLLKIIAISKGNKSFLETISILADGPNLGIWGDSPELRTSIKKLSDGIKTITQFCRPESIEHIFSRINYKSDVIGSDFYDLIKNLSPEQRGQVFEVFKDHLQKMITSALTYRYLTNALSEVQRTQLIEIFKSNWPTLIHNVYHYQLIANNLSEAQRTQVFEALKDHWPRIIKNSEDFKHLMHYLPLEQHAQVFHAFKNHWPSIIVTSHDFNTILNLLPIRQLILVIQELNQNWIEIIYGSKGFKTFQQTIFDLNATTRMGLMKDIPELKITIEKLTDGIEKLSQICQSTDIEHFLEAMLSQNTQSIRDTFDNLLNQN